MAEYICKDDIIKMLKEKEPLPFIENNFLIGVIEAFPTADVQPVVHGEWEWNPDGMDWGIGAWVCSQCHMKPETWWESSFISPHRCSGHNFCPNCGADMRRPES